MNEDDPTKELPSEQPAKDEIRVVNFADFANEVLSRLSALEQKIDERMIETRPLWERALAEIAETRQEMAEGRKEMNTKFRNLDRKFDQLARELFEMRASISDFDSRVADLEGKQS